MGVLLAIHLCVVPGLGAEEDDPPIEEVFQSELAYPQEKGELQVTFAPRFGHRDDTNAYDLPWVLEYGITDAWDVELEWTLLRQVEEDGESTAGIGDLEIGVRWSRPARGDSGIHVAAGLEVAVPIADVDRELSEGFIEYEPFVIVQKDFPQADFHLFAHLGLSLVDRVRTPETDLGDEVEPAAHELFVNIGFFLPLGRFHLTQELNWSNNRWNHDGEENELYWTPGLVVGLPGNQEIGLGVPIGLSDDADDFRVIAMWTWETELGPED